MEKLIPINITGARVDKIIVGYPKNSDDSLALPSWSAEVSLITQDGKSLTSIWVGSDEWDKAKCAEKSAFFLELAVKLRNEINVLVTQHINKFQKVLEATR